MTRAPENGCLHTDTINSPETEVKTGNLAVGRQSKRKNQPRVSEGYNRVQHGQNHANLGETRGRSEYLAAYQSCRVGNPTRVDQKHHRQCD